VFKLGMAVGTYDQQIHRMMTEIGINVVNLKVGITVDFTKSK